MPPTTVEVEVPEPTVALALGAEEEVEEAGGMVVTRVLPLMEVDGRGSIIRGADVLMEDVVGGTVTTVELGIGEVVVVGRTATGEVLDRLVVAGVTTWMGDVVTGAVALVEEIGENGSRGVVLDGAGAVSAGAVLSEENTAVGLNLGFSCFRP